MDHLRPLTFSVIKFVPDEVRYEPINVGIVLQDTENLETRVEITPKLGKISTHVDDTVNVDALRVLLDALAAGLEAGSPKPLNLIAGEQHHQLQFSPPLGTTAPDIAGELDTLYRRFISLDGRGSKHSRGVTKLAVKGIVSKTLADHRVAFEKRPPVNGRRLKKINFDYGVDNQLLNCISFGVEPEHGREDAVFMAYTAKDVLATGAARKFAALVYPPSSERPGSDLFYGEACDVLRDADVQVVDVVRGLESFVAALPKRAADRIKKGDAKKALAKKKA